MKPRPKPQDSGTQELFRAKLRNIINLGHELVRLGELIDWGRLEIHFAPYYREAGRPGLPIRLVVGLHLLKHIEGLSDEAVCARWERGVEREAAVTGHALRSLDITMNDRRHCEQIHRSFASLSDDNEVWCEL